MNYCKCIYALLVKVCYVSIGSNLKRCFIHIYSLSALFVTKKVTKAIAQLKKGIKNRFQITFSSYGASNASMTVE